MKTYIHTFDVFNSKDDNTRFRYFDACHKEALKCGLTCRCFIDYGTEHVTKLELWGLKSAFLEYYFRTLFLRDKPYNGCRRLMSILFT